MSTEACAFPASLPDDPALLKQIIAEQSATVASLSRKLTQLEHSLAQLLRRQYGPRSEQLDPRQQLLFGAGQQFFEAKEAHPGEAHAAMAFVTRLYEVEREAKGAPPERRLVLRRERSLPILAEFRAWLETVEAKVLPKSPLGQAIGYVLPRWEGLARYCEDGRLSIDNNLSERALRPCAIGRKNWISLGSDRGGRTAAVLFSVMASCKANQVEPFAYLRDVLSRASALGTANPSELDALLPDVWLQNHPDAHRPWSR